MKAWFSPGGPIFNNNYPTLKKINPNPPFCADLVTVTLGRNEKFWFQAWLPPDHMLTLSPLGAIEKEYNPNNLGPSHAHTDHIWKKIVKSFKNSVWIWPFIFKLLHSPYVTTNSDLVSTWPHAHTDQLRVLKINSKHCCLQLTTCSQWSHFNKSS